MTDDAVDGMDAKIEAQTPVPSAEPSANEFTTFGAVELLETDPSPIFVLDLTSATKTIPVYYNASLREVPYLETRVGKGQGARDSKYTVFIDWAASRHIHGSLLQTTYGGVRWTARTLRGRWRVVSGDARSQATFLSDIRRQSEAPRTDSRRSQTLNAHKHEKPNVPSKPAILRDDSLENQLAAFRLRREEDAPAVPSLVRHDSSVSNKELNLPTEVDGPIDITNPKYSRSVSAHIRYVLDFDWSTTELGPISQWSAELRREFNFLMADPRPAAMYWGQKRTLICNEPYVAVTGNRYERMLGKPFAQAWEEIADHFGAAFDTAHETGIAHTSDNARFDIMRHEYIEETYYNLAIIPFNIETGEIGFYNPVVDVTRQVIADRRMAFLLRLGEFIASSREPKDFWQQLLLGFEADLPDLPFGILFSAGGDINETLSESSEQSFGLRNWVLEGTFRVPKTCTSIPNRITTETGMDELLLGFFEFIKSESATLLTVENGLLPTWMVREIACESALLLPIRSTGDNVLGFLLLGVNPRKRYDSDYKVFMGLLSRQLATSMASALLFEEEIRRGRMAAEQAAQDQNLLSKRLVMQTNEALEIESRFRRMADLAPVGMFHIAPDGVLIYANNDYYEMTKHPRDVSYPMSWYNVIAEIDHPMMDQEWGKLLGGEPVTFELRLRERFVAKEVFGGEKVEGDTWIIASAYAEQAEDGTVTAILGCITDISRTKWMEAFQTRRMMEAVELKRQQENFIDMTSHEMRNPLSAIIQCADYIATSLAEFERGCAKDLVLPREVADGYADAAQTVVLCAQHQKRIIDDILTLSKLDSNLLLITPVEVQPIMVVQSALKMFDGEVQKSDMELRFRVDDSYQKLDIDWVKLDPSRLLQILINLTTNAIKFTQTEMQRKIDVNMSASTEPPLDRHGIQYLPRSTSREDMSRQGSAWGTGEEVYLYFEVQDSGRGLDDQERALLFKRFSQASPRTHVQYGGSGLGLFISRELTELQGGQIGVSSQAGVGSTFAFFIRARRCQPLESAILKSTPSIDLKAQPRVMSPAALATKIQNAPSSTKLEKPGGPPPPKHILIVEDNIVNQKVLSKQLRSAGCIVSVANHGREALTYLSTSRFYRGLESTGTELTIVLMDLEMPVMDGLTCVKEIRRLQREGDIVGHIPVIAVTANARSEQIATAKEAGMDSVVTKPFRIPELMPEIERQISRSRERVG